MIIVSATYRDAAHTVEAESRLPFGAFGFLISALELPELIFRLFANVPWLSQFPGLPGPSFYLPGSRRATDRICFIVLDRVAIYS